MSHFRFRLRLLIAGLAVAIALAFVVTDGADARVGGGSSSGSRGARTFSAPAPTQTAPRSAAPIERSMTQPGTAARPAPAPTGGGFFNRPGGMFGGMLGGGLLGGLAAGFLGAGLFGMLFGHGLFGGLGGISSVLGLILQIGLVALLARFLWGMWQRRSQPAFAGGSMFRNGPTGSGLGAMPMGAAAAAPATGSDEVGIKPADFDAFERLLVDTQDAYSREDVAGLRALATPEMLSYFSEQLTDNASRGVINRVSAVKLLQGDLAEAWREGDAEYATVAMRFALDDQIVERASGRVVGGDGPQEVTELWTFRRVPGGRWLLSAIQQG